MSEFDSPWKETLDQFLPSFLAFFFPEVHAGIDWSRSYELLDKELQKLVREGELGLRLVDKLFRVWRSGGEETWVLVHVELQAQVDSDFPERMFAGIAGPVIPAPRSPWRARQRPATCRW